MSDFSFINDPRWKKETPETKQVMTDNAFARDVASNPKFAKETPETQALMRENYQKQVALKDLGNQPFRPPAGQDADYKQSPDYVPDMSAWGATKDTAIDAGIAVINAGTAAVGTADLLTGNLAGNALGALGYDPEKSIEILKKGYSKHRQVAEAKVSKTKGFLPTINALLDHPSVAFGAIVQSAALTLSGAAAARVAATRILSKEILKRGLKPGSKAAIALTEELFKDKAIINQITRVGAITEGVQSAGMIQEGARAGGKSYTESVLPALAAGAGTAAIGVVSSRIPGFRDAEASVATAGRTTGKQGLIAKGMDIAKTSFKEGVLEELPQGTQEQIFTNLAMDKP
ncbi:MAG: hypothetical protein PF440_06350, partial [Thiomicrorhabdus sp.]|nr:hypothetical protein [Thiomicrorhabdus sp.]